MAIFKPQTLTTDIDVQTAQKFVVVSGNHSKWNFHFESVKKKSDLLFACALD